MSLKLQQAGRGGGAGFSSRKHGLPINNVLILPNLSFIPSALQLGKKKKTQQGYIKFNRFVQRASKQLNYKEERFTARTSLLLPKWFEL